MAHILPPVLNIDGSVGKSGENRFDDVQLVQTLMEAILSSALGPIVLSNAKRMTTPIPKTKLVVNGTYNAEFQGWIDFFLDYFRTVLGYSLVNDGKFDKLPRNMRGYRSVVTNYGNEKPAVPRAIAVLGALAWEMAFQKYTGAIDGLGLGYISERIGE